MNDLKEIDPFVRMQIDSLNWTGYNSELIDTVIEKGKVLTKENADLKASKAKLEKRALVDFWTYAGVAAGISAIVAIFLGLMIILLASVGTEKAYRGFEAGVQYSESLYRQVSPSHIKVSIKTPGYIYTSIDNSFKTEVDKEVFEKIKNGEIYTVYEEK